MNEQMILALVVFGGAIGLAIVGVAMWMMRQDPSTKPEAGTPTTPAPAEPTIPIIDPAQSPNPVSPAPPPAPSLTGRAGPAAPTPVAAADPIPPAAQPIAATPPQASAPDWLNSTAARPPDAPAPARADAELLRLWRSPTGDLIVEVNGRRYASRLEVTEYTVGQQIANAASDLNSFLNSFAPGPIRAAPPSAPAAPPKAAEAQSKLPSFFAPPKIERPVVKVSLEEAAQMEVKPPTMDISRQWRYLRDQQKKPEIQIKSVAEEIDEILQVTLLGTPLAGRGLKVSDGKHGVVFSCDGHNYDSVDHIPDAAAREAVRAAIQKWDQK
jgi:hypothetical protein